VLKFSSFFQWCRRWLNNAVRPAFDPSNVGNSSLHYFVLKQLCILQLPRAGDNAAKARSSPLSRQTISTLIIRENRTSTSYTSARRGTSNSPVNRLQLSNIITLLLVSNLQTFCTRTEWFDCTRLHFYGSEMFTRCDTSTRLQTDVIDKSP
jgi:hypothetical protein